MSGSRVTDAFGGELKLLRAARLSTGNRIAKRAGVNKSTVSKRLRLLGFDPELDFEFVKFTTIAADTGFSKKVIRRIAYKSGLEIVKTRFGFGIHQDDYDSLLSILEDDEPVMTMARAAKALGVSRRSLRQYLTGGLLEASLRRSKLAGNLKLLTQASVMALKRERDKVSALIACSKVIWAEKANRDLGLNWRQIKKICLAVPVEFASGNTRFYDAERFMAEAERMGFIK